MIGDWMVRTKTGTDDRDPMWFYFETQPDAWRFKGIEERANPTEIVEVFGPDDRIDMDAALVNVIMDLGGFPV